MIFSTHYNTVLDYNTVQTSKTRHREGPARGTVHLLYNYTRIVLSPTLAPRCVRPSGTTPHTFTIHVRCPRPPWRARSGKRKVLLGC